MDFAVAADYRVKIKESKERKKFLDLAREIKTALKHEGDGDINCNCYARNNPQRFHKETRIFRNQRTSRDHPDYSIIKISQNTENSPGDLLSLKLL